MDEQEEIEEPGVCSMCKAVCPGAWKCDECNRVALTHLPARSRTESEDLVRRAGLGRREEELDDD